MSHEHLFSQHLETIDGVITLVCRLHNASIDEAEEFRSLAREKLIENDCHRLRKFKGDCSIKAYLAKVIDNLFKDYRNSKWGKWRPTVAAARQGDVGRLLEQYTVRDRMTFDQAVALLRAKHGVHVPEAELWQIYERLPMRIDRRPEDEEKLAYVVDRALRPDEILEESQRTEQVTRASELLPRLIGTFTPQDRRILRLRHFSGMPVVDIARLLDIDQKALYRRCEWLLAELERLLRLEGVDPALLGFG